jgi:16S rRNA (adenine1518-N6/adenine1519-N6)-dimethyltransferase
MTAGREHETPRRARWSEIKAALEMAGFEPSRTLGQNFLVDENMLRAIVRDARVEPGELILEVGPGAGVLTAQLLAAGAKVIAVEIDERLAQFSREFLGEEHVQWIVRDALEGKHALAPELLAALPPSAPWKLVSNLPYSAGTPILAALARLPNPPRSATVLLQKDLALRLAAEPGSKTYGAISARLQALYAIEHLRDLGPQLFWPRPQVDSSLLRLELRSERPSAALLAELDRLLDTLFSQRRKTIRNRLAEHFGSGEEAERLCALVGLDPLLRAEDVGHGPWLALLRSRTTAP